MAWGWFTTTGRLPEPEGPGAFPPDNWTVVELPNGKRCEAQSHVALWWGDRAALVPQPTESEAHRLETAVASKRRGKLQRHATIGHYLSGLE